MSLAQVMATPQRTPLVSRSDGRTYPLFLEESYVRSLAGTKFEIIALFRYDLDTALVTGESAMALIPVSSDDSALVQRVIGKVADKFAEIPCSWCST
jgi:hypothetical protein